MKLLSFFQRKPKSTDTPDRAAILHRYKRLRATQLLLGEKLSDRLKKDMLKLGAKRLGLFRGGMLVFGADSEMPILMDYCIHHVRRAGRNVVEQQLIESDDQTDEAELACLRSLQHSIYSLFVVESVHRGLGVTVRDLWTDETALVADLGFGSSAVEGLVLASRLIFDEGFAITGGAAIPFCEIAPDQRSEFVRNYTQIRSRSGEFDPAELIRKCLAHGCSSNVSYRVPKQVAGQTKRQRTGERKFSPAKNDPCPCGSGRRYKKCCMPHS